MCAVNLLLLALAAGPGVDLLPADGGVRLLQIDGTADARLVLDSAHALAVIEGRAMTLDHACLDLKARQRGVVLVLPEDPAVRGQKPETHAPCPGHALAPEGEYPVGTIGRAKFLGHAAFAYAGELALDPGAEVKPHQHEGSDEVIVIQSGGGTFTVAGTERRVGPRDALHIPKGTTHAFVAGPQPVKAIQFYSPAGPEERFRVPKN
jgi:quercetin dioxygenase-like cupin family protein